MRKEMLIDMLKTGSVSGREIELQKKVMKYMEGIADEVITDETGNVSHLINPEAPFRVMMLGHIDEIGLWVTHVNDNGTLKVYHAGGIRRSMYLGHKVRIYTKKGIIYGAVLSNSELCKKTDLKDSDLTIDIGATNREEALSVVGLGDTVTIDEDYRPLLNDRFTARAIDDRGGAFIVLEALRRAKEKGCTIGAIATTSVGEEETGRGAYWAASRLDPALSVAVDVTYATDYDGSDPAETGDVKIGKGPVICRSSMSNQRANALLEKCAEDLGITLQIETFPGRTGTDADTIHLTHAGHPTVLLSLPLRYMHSHAELGSWKDIEQSIELLAEFLCRITADYSLSPFAD